MNLKTDSIAVNGYDCDPNTNSVNEWIYTYGTIPVCSTLSLGM